MNNYIFDPTIHIRKFGFELFDHAMISNYEYKILGDMYQKEISFIFTDKLTNEIVDNIGFELSAGKMNSLLPLIVWEDYEKYRDLPEDWFWNPEKHIKDTELKVMW